MTSFETLGVGPPILRALDTLGFDAPTEIQAAAIPSLMAGNDLIGVAQTGGGKTAAFVIPMLERIAGYADKPKPGMPRALILAPTRELAIQITDKIKELSTGTNARCCTVYGGAPYRTQLHILRRGVDILVATPGRLKDHMKQGNIYLDEAEYFVLDEADRMLDMGFVDEVRTIAKRLPSGHQSVMFSATMNGKVSELAETILRDAVRVEVARQATIANNLAHKVMFVPGHKKNDLLLDLIEAEKPEKLLLFVRTKRDADQMASFLAAVGFKTEAIHGDKKQAIRQRIIEGFKIGRFDILVATDVAARGIDITDISHVINMDVPVEAESYVHRIGRTARAGASGRAITLCGKNDLRLLKDIENLIKMKIDVDDNHPYRLKLNGPARKAAAAGQHKGDHKPWEKRAKKRASKTEYDPTQESRPAKKPRKQDAHKSERTFEKRPSEKRPGEKRSGEKQTGDRRENAAAGKPHRTERAQTSGPSSSSAAGDAGWAKSSEGAGKPLTRKTAKRVDPSANKRKAKAGAKKKRPAVAARKAKSAQTKAFRKPESGKNTSGGNQTLRRRTR